MKVSNLDILFFLSLAIPAMVVFLPLLSSSTIAWGDAPHFVGSEFGELLGEPSVWISRGENLGGVDPRIWIRPLLVVYGGLGKFLRLSNEIIVRLMFYLPAIILSFVGPIYVARKLGFSKTVSYFASLFYVFNTYFILLIDGGQVGIALAYGLFPFVFISIVDLFTKRSFVKYFISLILLFVMSIVDPRIAILSLLTAIVWTLARSFKLWKDVAKQSFLLVIAWFGLNAYWIIPLVRIEQSSLSLGVSSLELISLLNGLFLYQPHWPSNVFGDITWPPWYFVGLAILVFGSVYLSKSKQIAKYALVFLLFVFLLKGSTPPFGFIYEFFVKVIPFGSAFRDSSKFFIPLMLIGGFLIGISTDILSKTKKNLFLITNGVIRIGVVVIVYIYIFLLIFPALSGQMNFVLSGRNHSPDLDIINERIEAQNEYFRTAWFPERYPLTYETELNPALNAKYLVELAPLRFLTAGSSDKFNYMYQSENYLDWYRLLGIKYLIFSGDQRISYPTYEEEKEWKRLLTQIESTGGVDRVDWSDDIPVYEVNGSYPRVFSVDSMALVVGPMIQGDSGPIPAVYFEDGKLDPRDLQGTKKEVGTIVFNGGSEDDLTMSFLQDYFVGAEGARFSAWADYLPENYSDTKYQLLIRDIEMNEFDYGKGISISTEQGEGIEFELSADESVEQILALRVLSGASDGVLEIEISGKKFDVFTSQGDKFEWILEGVVVTNGSNALQITNKKGVNAINAVALIPMEDWNEAKRLTDVFLSHFGTTDIEEVTGVTPVRRGTEFEKKSPIRYEIASPALPLENPGWIVLSDSYDPNWKLWKGDKYLNSLPAYSMVNAFYIEPNWTSTRIEFIGQKELRWGIYYSVISFLILTIIFILFIPTKKNESKK